MKILQLPDTRLRELSVPVTRFDHDLQELASQMISTCRANNGLGLAAPQVDRRVRMIVVKKKPSQNFFVLVNPEWRQTSAAQSRQLEGCLSIPGFFAEVQRYTQVEVSYRTITGAQAKFRSTGEMAMAYQHEIDHLDGKLFIDHLPKAASEVLMSKYMARLEEQRMLAARRVL